MGITRTGNGLVHEMDTLLNKAARPKDAFGLFQMKSPGLGTLLGGKMPGMGFGKAAPAPTSEGKGKTAWDGKIPRLLETRHNYNAKGLLTLTCQGSRFVRYTYNDQDLVTSISDALGRTTRFLYNSKGQLYAVEMPDGGKIAFSYDEAGHLSAISTPLGATHGLDLDASDLDTAYKAPLSGVYRQIYDTKGRVVKKEFPSGKTVSYSYKDDALVLVKLPEGEVKLSYGPDGLTRVSMGREAVTYRYEQGLLAGEWRLGTLERELAYKYGKNGRLASFAYSGAVQSYEYDEKGRLVRAGSFTINREAENGLAMSVTGRNMQISRQYSQYGELDAQKWTVDGLPAAWWSVERDAAGQIVRKVQVAGGQVVDYAYGYDAGGRLLQVKKDGSIVEEYLYNANGARVFEVNRLAGISGRAYSYDAEGRLITAGDMRFAYDPDGFLTQKTDNTGETKYAYALRGGLLRVDIPGGTVVEYVNDPFGRRIAKKVNGNIVEKYLWQGQTRLLALCDGWDNLLCRFVYADARTPVAMEQAGRIFYLSYDQVGSLRQVTDSSGKAVKVMEYDSFGNIIKDSAPGFFLPIGFAGGLLDRHTGLVRFGYRDYYSQIGRWTAKDPIGFAAGDVDLFGYVGNDPVNAVDPWGLLSYEENRQRRKDINSGYTNKIIKTGVGLLVGKEIIKNFSKAGLGVTAGELIKQRGNIATLGVFGTVSNFLATALIKAALVGGSFYTGIEGGTNIGAYLDTIVDGGDDFLGISPEQLEKLGFGSGIPNELGL